MFKTTRRSAARLAAAGLTAGLLAAGALATAGPALADSVTPSSSGATAVLQGLETGKYDRAIVNGDPSDTVAAGLFQMAVDGGGTIETYCIDFNHHTQKSAAYNEVAWGASTLGHNPNAGKIAWILNNSYPKVDAAALASTLKAGGVNLDHPLTDALAAAGTQVAIWHLSDPDVRVQAQDSDAKALSDYLDAHAQTLDEPKPSLSLDPAAVSGKSGDRIGPITVHTSAGKVDLALGAGVPTGVKIVDASGKAVTTVENGSKLYFQIPAGTSDGSTTVTVSATTDIAVGRAFSATNTSSQSQILAGSHSTTVTAAATVSWAKKGPIPALSAKVACSKHGVDVTASNQGDEDFTFQLEGRTYTIAPGKSQTITVPVAEDQKYKIDITLPNGTVKTFEGVLDCTTATSPAPSTPASAPSQSVNGSTGKNLAETGSSSATPVIAGVAIALVVLGGGAVFFVRRKKNSASAE